MNEHELLLKMTNGYSPPWNIAAKKYHCGFCYNYITKESHLKRPESHRIECVYIQALEFLHLVNLRLSSGRRLATRLSEPTSQSSRRSLPDARPNLVRGT